MSLLLCFVLVQLPQQFRPRQSLARYFSQFQPTVGGLALFLQFLQYHRWTSSLEVTSISISIQVLLNLIFCRSVRI